MKGVVDVLPTQSPKGHFWQAKSFAKQELNKSRGKL